MDVEDRYVMVAIDYFSRMIWTEMVKERSAAEIVSVETKQFIDLIFFHALFGKPVFIL